MSFQFSPQKEIKVYVPKREKPWVMLAAEDLISDIRRLSFPCSLVDSEKTADIIISTAEGETSPLSHSEEYQYTVGEQIRIEGFDDLGTMWGVYAFAEHELGINPSYLFDGFHSEPQNILTLAEKTCRDYPKTAFRGWFINDEDLLSGYKNLGEREIDYPFYKKIIAPDLMDKIAETALRHKINLIIPSTLVDITNPYEYGLVERIARRGIYVSQHHVEPLGVSHYGMAKFLRSNGYSEEISFVKNQEGMTAAWRKYVSLWAKFPRVYYQLGLRGSSDVPVWKTDKNVGESNEERGQLISKAIKTQYDIVKEFAGENALSSITVWMESAALLEEGYLSIPRDTTVVFSDIGASQMFGAEFFSVPRKPNTRYGIYYHSAYWNVGPHLAEGVNPEKMMYNYRLAWDTQADYYSVLNVANIREFTFSLALNADLIFHKQNFDYDAWLRHYAGILMPEHETQFVKATETYYSALLDVGEEEYRGFCKRNHFNYQAYPDAPFPNYALSDGFLVWYLRRPFEDNAFHYYNPIVNKAVISASAVMKTASDAFADMALSGSDQGERKEAFKRLWYYQSLYYSSLLRGAACLADAVIKAHDGEEYDLKKVCADVANALKTILKLRKDLFTGQWANWFSFEKKLDIERLYNEMIEKSL